HCRRHYSDPGRICELDHLWLHLVNMVARGRGRRSSYHSFRGPVVGESSPALEPQATHRAGSLISRAFFHQLDRLWRSFSRRAEELSLGIPLHSFLDLGGVPVWPPSGRHGHMHLGGDCHLGHFARVWPICKGVSKHISSAVASFYWHHGLNVHG